MGAIINGFDYENQAWVSSGKYIRCGHLESFPCSCYGRIHEGEDCRTEAANQDVKSMTGPELDVACNRAFRELDALLESDPLYPAMLGELSRLTKARNAAYGLGVRRLG